MAHSPGSAERRSRLIREMSRGHDRVETGNSAASSVASDIHEPLRGYETDSHELPPIPPRADFQINTSALRRAFPNFSQYGSSEEDSIEFGRGGRTSLRNKHDSMLSADVTQDISIDFGGGERYKITGTPPLGHRQLQTHNANALSKPTAIAKRTLSEKENHDPSPKTAGDTTDDVVVQEPKGRPALAELHNIPRSDNDGVSKPEPPQTGINGTANSRFSRVQNERRVANNALDPQTASGTYQSFLLPDLPNITELVSGVRQDGTPLFSRSSKPRSRFSTPSQGRRVSSIKLGHVAVGKVPVPADERALYASLQLLQEKVAALESQKLESEKKADDLETEVLQLRSKLDDQELNDSGLGSEDGHWQREKTEIETSVKELQARLSQAHKKASNSEMTINDLTKDREAAHEQLAVAYTHSEELKAESRSLRHEIKRLSTQFNKLTREYETRLDHLVRQEAELRAKMERREKAVKEMSSLTKELWETRTALNNKPPHHSTGRARSNTYLSRAASSPKSSGSLKVDSDRAGFASTRASEFGVVNDVDSTTELVLPGAISRSNQGRVAAELTKNTTYLSFMDGDEPSKLRRILEDDMAKLSASASRGASQAETVARDLSTAQKSSILGRQPMPRKSSLKNTSKGKKQQVQYADAEAIGNSYAEPHNEDPAKDETQRSVGSRQSMHRQRSSNVAQAEMTSAFILPDITLSGSAITDEARRGKLSVSVPRPVPVSERMPVAREGEDEPTLRPAQNPAVALATVLKILEDELAQLRRQLAETESIYTQHDPSLSKTKRRIVYARIQKLLTTIESKSDQIYALYDVLEGQKEHGQRMDESEVEVTLLGVGIDLGRLSNASARPSSQSASQRQREMEGAEKDTAYSDSDDDLPWEGIEQTQTQSLGSLRGLSIRA